VDDDVDELLTVLLGGGVAAADALAEETADSGEERKWCELRLGLEAPTPEDLRDGGGDGEKFVDDCAEAGSELERGEGGRLALEVIEDELPGALKL